MDGPSEPLNAAATVSSDKGTPYFKVVKPSPDAITAGPAKVAMSGSVISYDMPGLSAAVVKVVLK